MKVCIAGGGRVGMYLAQSLLSHRHKVTIIEPQEALCRTLADTLDIPVICGDSLSFDTLRTADVASCDAFVAVTNTDETNLVACQIAKREFGVNRTVARASNPKNRDILHTLGVDTVVCDPVLYRIRYIEHHRQGTKWCIFPMYDFAHPIQDALEGITHSLCSLEYEDHRPLYDWVVNNVSVPCKPRQIEFSRLGINYTVMSKRKLRRLVEEGYVSSWDDPRMPTLCGLRRRGYTPASIRNFCERIGVSKVASTVDYSFLEHCLREDLNLHAQRAMAVLHPVKLRITNYPEGQSETFAIENNPEDEIGRAHV